MKCGRNILRTHIPENGNLKWSLFHSYIIFIVKSTNIPVQPYKNVFFIIIIIIILIIISLSSYTSDLLPLVIVSLVIGYVDQTNQFASSEVKFATAVSSIIPLSYYIGMGIAR